MKLISLTIFFTSFLVFNGSAQFPDPQESFKQFLESTRPRFKCGFPLFQIPPLEPYFLSNYSSTLNTVGGLSNINFPVFNTTVSGLSKFQIKKLEMVPWESKLSFALNYPVLQFNGTHKITSVLNRENLVGNGLFDVTAYNVSIAVNTFFDWFPVMKIKSSNVTSGSISSVDATFHGFKDKATDNAVSENFSKGGPAWLQNNLKQINTELDHTIVAFSSNRLNNFMNLDHIFKEIMTFNPSKPCA